VLKALDEIGGEAGGGHSAAGCDGGGRRQHAGLRADPRARLAGEERPSRHAVTVTDQRRGRPARSPGRRCGGGGRWRGDTGRRAGSAGNLDLHRRAIETPAHLQRYQALAAQSFSTLQQRDTQLALVEQDTTAIKNDQAQIDYATIQLRYTAIASPIGGRTGVRMIDAGNIVHATDTTGLVLVRRSRRGSAV
jgi:hypothetical protein